MTTQHAVQITARDQLEINPALPVPVVGPTQLLLKVEACGICFSDTKLMHAFDQHPRKTPIQSGISPERLSAIPTYRPGADPIVPGHEPAARIVEVGSDLSGFTIGQRVVVQTDYRHLPTAASTASLGYDFDGALEEYILVDEAMVVDPATGQHYLIPVGEAPSAGAVAMLEPWACVENAYACPERTGLAPGGSVLIVAETGTQAYGLVDLISQAQPSRVVVVGPLNAVLSAEFTSLDNLTGWFDDIIYIGAQAETVETISRHLAKAGRLNIVLNGGQFDRPVEVDAGRLHYDLIRYVGTTGADVAEGYRWIPPTDDLRPGESLAIIGAAGPMGLMHAVRAVTTGPAGLTLDAVDINLERLTGLRTVLDELAAGHQVPVRVFDSSGTPLAADTYTYVSLLVPSGALLQEAVRVAAPGAIVQAFAGFAVGTMAAIDLNKVVGAQIFMVGTSGSRIVDMATVLERLESGRVDTNISIDAICGMAGVPDAIAAVDNRTSQGKIVVFPSLPKLKLIRLADLAGELPSVAEHLARGRWCKAAECALFATSYPAAAEPAEPVVQPVEPVVEPVEPVAELAEPVVELVEPVVEPVGPAVETVETAVVSAEAEPPVGVESPVEPEPLAGGISPRAWRAAEAAGIDPTTVTGTGPDGRVTEADIRGLTGAEVAAPAEVAAATPQAVRLAQILGVDITALTGSGLGGVVTEADIQAAVGSRLPPPPPPPPEPEPELDLPLVPDLPPVPDLSVEPDVPAVPEVLSELDVPAVPDVSVEPEPADEPAPDRRFQGAAEAVLISPVGHQVDPVWSIASEPEPVQARRAQAALDEADDTDAAAPELDVVPLHGIDTDLPEALPEAVVEAPLIEAPLPEAAETAGGYHDSQLAGAPLLLAGQMLAGVIGRVPATYVASAPAAGLLSAQERYQAALGPGADPVSPGQVVAGLAVAVAQRRPAVNAIRQDRLVRHFDDVHLGQVVDTTHGSVMVTLRRANRLAPTDLAAAMAQAGPVVDEADELGGATFGLADLSTTGVEVFLPVLSGSPVAVLGIGAVHPGAVALPEGGVGLAERITLALTVDRTAVDSQEAAGFLADLVAAINRLDRTPVAD